MREKVLKKILSWAIRHDPKWIRVLELQILTDLAGKSFGVRKKRVWHLSPEQALSEYAAFTVQCQKTGGAEPAKIYKDAYSLGKKIRGLTGFRDRADLKKLIFYLYRNIGITMDGNLPGKIMIARCYFSDIYTPEQCRIMSCVDAGVIAGISGGGTLIFRERITEGCGKCIAAFYVKGASDES